MPSSVGTGIANDATVTAYDASYNVATGYTGTIHFTSTDGAATLPLNYTFTGSDAGVHTFTGGVTMRTTGSQIVTAIDIADATINGSKGVTVAVFPSTPTGLTATAATTTLINISWSASSGASQYEVVRKSSSSGYTTLIVTSSTNYSDTSVIAGASYVYKVRAIDAALHQSAFSAPDAATTIFFSDNPLVVATTPAKAVHVTELRQAVSALRATAGLSAASFTDASLAGVALKAVHIQELRTALNQALTALGINVITFTDPTITPGATIVRAAHVQELRGGVK